MITARLLLRFVIPTHPGFVASLVLASCGSAPVHPSAVHPGERPLPRSLGVVLVAYEDVHADYVALTETALAVTFDEDGTGRATSEKRSTGVLDGHSETTRRSATWIASARWAGARITLELDPVDPVDPSARPVVLECERWTPDHRADAAGGAVDRALPGVDWACAVVSDLERAHRSALHSSMVSEVPRAGGYVLLGETRGVHVDIVTNGSGSTTLQTRVGDLVGKDVALREPLSAIEAEPALASIPQGSESAPARRALTPQLRDELRACGESERDERAWRCRCEVLCAAPIVPSADGATASVRYPLLGGDGLLVTAAPDGSVSECSFRFRAIDVRVQCVRPHSSSRGARPTGQ